MASCSSGVVVGREGVSMLEPSRRFVLPCRLRFTDNTATVSGAAAFWDTLGDASVPCALPGAVFSGNTVNG